jgi:phospholipid/cholesterol/gamma-HCH transport system substrate-binding protein
MPPLPDTRTEPSTAPAASDPAPPNGPLPRYVGLKAAALLLLVTLLVAGFLLYVMYARGLFESTQQLVLLADDSEGVLVGADVTFSGFPIGRVRRIELGADGRARLVIDVARKDAHWLRTSSVFTLERGMVGEPRIRAFSGILSDPPLPENAERVVLRGDTSAEIPRLVASTRALLDNLDAMTAPGASINSTLASLSTLSARLNGQHGMLTGLLGSEDKARKVITTIDNTNALLANTDQRLFGKDGLTDDAQTAVRQLSGMLGDARNSLRQVDALLAEAQTVAGNARLASTDLGQLRAEVETSLRRVSQLVDDINRKWPFARDKELKLP